MNDKTFLVDLTETELRFLINAIHEVNIAAKDARFVSDFQTKLVEVLTKVEPAEPPAGTAVV